LNLKIKKEHIATPLISDHLCIKMVLFSNRIILSKKRSNCNTIHFRLFMYLNCVIFQAHCVYFEVKKDFRLFLYLNGVIFQAHWVNFEIKKRTNCNTTDFRLFMYLNGMFYQKLCVDFEEKINEWLPQQLLLRNETSKNKEFQWVPEKKKHFLWKGNTESPQKFSKII
jgi:hypothetical protein